MHEKPGNRSSLVLGLGHLPTPGLWTVPSLRATDRVPVLAVLQHTLSETVWPMFQQEHLYRSDPLRHHFISCSKKGPFGEGAGQRWKWRKGVLHLGIKVLVWHVLAIN